MSGSVRAVLDKPVAARTPRCDSTRIGLGRVLFSKQKRRQGRYPPVAAILPPKARRGMRSAMGRGFLCVIRLWGKLYAGMRVNRRLPSTAIGIVPWARSAHFYPLPTHPYLLPTYHRHKPLIADIRPPQYCPDTRDWLTAGMIPGMRFWQTWKDLRVSECLRGQKRW